LDSPGWQGVSALGSSNGTARASGEQATHDEGSRVRPGGNGIVIHPIYDWDRVVAHDSTTPNQWGHRESGFYLNIGHLLVASLPTAERSLRHWMFHLGGI